MTTGLLERKSLLKGVSTTIKGGQIIEFSNKISEYNRLSLPLEFPIGDSKTKEVEILRAIQEGSSLFVTFVTDKETIYCEEISMYSSMKSLTTLFGFQTATVIDEL